MKKQTLIIAFLSLFCCVHINAQPPNYDARCEQYLVNFCKDILAKSNTDCLQWDWSSSGYDIFCSPQYKLYRSMMPITRSGSVMIGAHSLLDVGVKSKLAVTGGIISTSLRVIASAWPDYVFDPSYKLMPLSDVKNFIHINKHLPNTPSANDIEKEGGFNVGEIFINHQEKIEEIYLHLIALKKEITGLQKEDADLDMEQIELLLAFASKIDTLIKK
jgi:hypothetical protein